VLGELQQPGGAAEGEGEQGDGRQRHAAEGEDAERATAKAMAITRAATALSRNNGPTIWTSWTSPLPRTWMALIRESGWWRPSEGGG
jgi:hypothetical protein